VCTTSKEEYTQQDYNIYGFKVENVENCHKDLPLSMNWKEGIDNPVTQWIYVNLRDS